MKEMTNREHLMAMLDEDPSDQVTRAILADLIEENPRDRTDVWLSKGLRLMVANNKYPYKSRTAKNVWLWFRATNSSYSHEVVSLPSGLWCQKVYRSRADAEFALADALHLWEGWKIWTKI